MPAQRIVCRLCGAEYGLEQLYSCPKCDGTLEVTRTPEMGDAQVIMGGGATFRRGVWKYFELLPVSDPAHVVTLGEGDTPLIRETRLPEAWGAGIDLFIKAESLNPSGSFKDRPTTVGVSVAKELGQDTLVVSSSGNAGAATAAYAARAGMRCVVLVPEATDPGKVAQTIACGAEVVRVKGHFSRCFHFARRLASRFGWTNLVSTYLNPYTVEGDKTVAYELHAQLDGRVPDYIFIPIGSGPLLFGVFKGYREMRALGLAERLPRMVGVQAESCEPITRAFISRQPVRAWDTTIATIAGGIADALSGYEKDGDLTVATVRESGGTMLSLTEAEIEEATRLVETKTGLYCEPTGAVSVGGAKKMCRDGLVPAGSTVVCLMTGHGFKFSRRRVETLPLVDTVDAAIGLFR